MNAQNQAPKQSGKPVVAIVMGSKSDAPVMQAASKLLKKFGIEHETVISSAHRSPKQTAEYAESAESRGIKVIIAGAGWAAHLAGTIAARTVLPVIGVPIDSSPLKGLDALYSTVQMPPGVPVATMGIGEGGAKNAAVLAAQILAVSDPEVREKLRSYKTGLANKVAAPADG